MASSFAAAQPASDRQTNAIDKIAWSHPPIFLLIRNGPALTRHGRARDCDVRTTGKRPSGQTVARNGSPVSIQRRNFPSHCANQAAPFSPPVICQARQTDRHRIFAITSKRRARRHFPRAVIGKLQNVMEVTDGLVSMPQTPRRCWIMTSVFGARNNAYGLGFAGPGAGFSLGQASQGRPVGTD